MKVQSEFYTFLRGELAERFKNRLDKIHFFQGTENFSPIKSKKKVSVLKWESPICFSFSDLFLMSDRGRKNKDERKLIDVSYIFSLSSYIPSYWNLNILFSIQSGYSKGREKNIEKHLYDMQELLILKEKEIEKNVLKQGLFYFNCLNEIYFKFKEKIMKNEIEKNLKNVLVANFSEFAHNMHNEADTTTSFVAKTEKAIVKAKGRFLRTKIRALQAGSEVDKKEQIEVDLKEIVLETQDFLEQFPETQGVKMLSLERMGFKEKFLPAPKKAEKTLEKVVYPQEYVTYQEKEGDNALSFDEWKQASSKDKKAKKIV